MRTTNAILLFLICISTLAIAQKPKDLVGKWKYDKLEYKGEFIVKEDKENSLRILKKMVKESGAGIKDEELEISFDMMMAIFDMIIYDFKKDGTVTISGQNGKYTLNKNKLTIITDENQEKTELDIEINKSMLIVKDASNGSKMYFKKM